MDTGPYMQYRSPGGVNYSILDAPYQSRDALEVNPDVYPYDASHESVPGFINGTGFFNGSDVFADYDASSVSPNGTNVTIITCDVNTTCTNGTEFVPLPMWQIGLFGLLAAGTILLTIAGNLVVIMSFFLERAIRQPTNYFIASLAVSDLLIGTMSMPFYTVYLLNNQKWMLGPIMCDFWLSVDYTVCLTSIYTVFAITVDRYCSVTIPAKYRNWRSENKVYVIIACTWIMPVVLFFTSIFGWQYFVGYRSVTEETCYVQYLEEPIFSCILQVSYFWATLLVMCVLYTGIYKVALDLQRKAEAKRKKMTSLVSIAGQTMTRIGIGMSQQGGVDTSKLFSQTETNATLEVVTEVTVSDVQEHKKERQQHNKANNNHGATGTNSSLQNPEKEDDRSSSPAFPSDTDPSSQSPKRSPLPKSRDAPKHHRKRARSNSEKESKPFKLQKPPKGRKSRRASSKGLIHVEQDDTKANNNINVSTLVSDSIATPNTCTTDLPPSKGSFEGHENPILAVGIAPPDYGTLTPHTQSPTETRTLLERGCIAPVSPSVPNTTGAVVSASPELLSGVKYIDQESLQSLQSSDNLRNLAEAAKVLAACKEATTSCNELTEEPESPIWKMRASVIARNQTNENSPAKSPLNKPHSVSPHAGQNTPSNTPVVDSMVNSPVFTPSPNHHSTTTLTVETRGNDSRPTTHIVRSHNMDNQLEKGSKKGKNKCGKGEGGSPLSSFVKTVQRSKRGVGRNKSKQKQTKQSRSENRARKALRTITIILGAFVLCWTPWHILSLILGFTKEPGVVLMKLYDISYWLCYLNSPINPLCYAFANAQFKKTFIRIMKLDWKRR